MGRQGRIVIPAELREQLAFEEGERLIARVVDGELRVMTYRDNLRRIRTEIQDGLAERGLTGADVMAEFLADRRRDAEAERRER